MLPYRATGQLAARATSRAAIAPRGAVRTYAAAAASSGTSHNPPIPLYGVGGTYASALYTAASKTSSLDSTAQALRNLSAVFKKDTHLTQILSTPTLSASDKSQVVAELQKHVGGVQDKGGVLKNFLNTLAENNRLGLLEPVCEEFGSLMGAHRGEVEMVVTSASPVDAKVLKQLENSVSKSKYVGQGKTLKVVPKVNPDIKGGLIVEIGDRTIDLSVSSKVAKMNKLLGDAL